MEVMQTIFGLSFLFLASLGAVKAIKDVIKWVIELDSKRIKRDGISDKSMFEVFREAERTGDKITISALKSRNVSLNATNKELQYKVDDLMQKNRDLQVKNSKLEAIQHLLSTETICNLPDGEYKITVKNGVVTNQKKCDGCA